MGVLVCQISASAQVCNSIELISLYTGGNTLYYQQSAASALLWQPTGQIFVVTTAHSVNKSISVTGVCANKVIDFQVLHLDSDRDVALLSTQTNSDLIKPLFIFPQGDPGELAKSLEQLRDSAGLSAQGSPFYEHKDLYNLAIAHPMFASLDLSESAVRVLGRTRWKAQIDTRESIYKLQSSMMGMINQVVINADKAESYDNPFVGFTPYFMSLGVRPGMSGSPVFHMTSSNFKTARKVLVGLVSKTKPFENLTVLTPSLAIEQTIIDHLAGQSPVQTMSTLFDSKTGIFSQSVKVNNYVFEISSESSHRNTSEIQSVTESPKSNVEIVLRHQNRINPNLRIRFDSSGSVRIPSLQQHKAPGLNAEQVRTQERGAQKTQRQGGADWADGGGHLESSSFYKYNPYFTEARYVPQFKEDLFVAKTQDDEYSYFRTTDGSFLPIYSAANLVRILNQDGSPRNLLSRNQVINSPEFDECAMIKLPTGRGKSQEIITPSEEAIKDFTRREVFGASLALTARSNNIQITSKCSSQGLSIDIQEQSLVENLIRQVIFSTENSKASLRFRSAYCDVTLTGNYTPYNTFLDNGQFKAKIFANHKGEWMAVFSGFNHCLGPQAQSDETPILLYRLFQTPPGDPR